MNKRFSIDVDEEKQIVDKEAIKIFAKGALDHSVDISIDNWEKEDPEAKPSYNFRLRLNKYEVGLLNYVKTIEKRSAHNLIKLILIKELQNRCKKTPQ